jgi:hypothetical protein
MRSTLLFVCLALLGACATDADVDVIVTEAQGGPDITQHALSNNEHTAYSYFVRKGLSPVQSAAIVGNLMQESSVVPTAVEYGGGPGRGIAQWSVGGRYDRSANDNLTSYASEHGVSRSSLTTQLDFIWYELTAFPGYGLSSLRAATTINSAVYAFQSKYEVCGTCASSKRISYANQVLAAYGNSSPTPTPPPADATCYSSTLGRDMPENACVQSAADDNWYQCSGGAWVDRFSDPDACNGEYPL